MLIEFGKFLPDQPEIFSPHLLDAKNIIPRSSGYEPFRAHSALSQALSTRVRGAAALRDSDGTVHVYAGDETDLQELETDGTWTELTRSSGGDYATLTTSRWNFSQFGDYAIATNFDDEPQVVDMTTANNFADLTGSPPQAKHITTFSDFVVLGYTDTSPSEIAWSAINDHTGWTAGTNQSDTQTFPDGGFVQGFATHDVLIIFQQKKIRRMQYVGPPTIMQIDVIEQNRGCLEPNSIAQHGRRVFFLADDGFHMIHGSDEAIPIGEQMVDRWFFSDFNEAYAYRMSAAVDPDKEVAYWSYPSTSSPNGDPDTLLMYYWPEQKWSYARVGAEFIFPSLSLGYTLDDLDSLTTNIDTFDIPLDDPILQGGTLRLGAFNTSDIYGIYAGANIEATIETGDLELIPNGRAYVAGVRPITDADDLTVTVAARERAMDNEAYTTAGTLEDHGMVSLEATGRYVRSKMVIGAGDAWNVAQGIAYDFQADGVV